MSYLKDNLEKACEGVQKALEKLKNGISNTVNKGNSSHSNDKKHESDSVAIPEPVVISEPVVIPEPVAIPEPVVIPEATALPYDINTPKVGRNNLCPCGSGKKFKKCCLLLNPQ